MSPEGHADPRREALEEFAHRARSAALVARLDAAALEACQALAAAQIAALLLKGGALAQMLYRPDEQRGYFDVDLLTPSPDRARAGLVLGTLGYANVTDLHGVDDVAGDLHAHHWTRPAPDLVNVSIDLHWRLPGCKAPPEAVWDALSRHRITIELGGGRLPTLDRAALALHLGLHAAQHGPEDLKAIGDLSRGLSRWPRETWEEATRLAQELRGVEAFAAGLRLLTAGVAVADELGLPPADAELWAIAHRDERPRGVFHLTAFSEAGTARERFGIARRALLPKREWIVGAYPWAARGPVGLIAAYGLHALRSPAWAVRAWRFRRRVAQRGGASAD